MSKKNPIDIAKPYFEGKSKHDELFVTTDGQVFTTESLAKAHSPRLANKEVTKVTRDEALDPKNIKVKGAKNVSSKGDAKKTSGAKKEAASGAKKEAASGAKKEAASDDKSNSGDSTKGESSEKKDQ